MTILPAFQSRPPTAARPPGDEPWSRGGAGRRQSPSLLGPPAGCIPLRPAVLPGRSRCALRPLTLRVLGVQHDRASGGEVDPDGGRELAALPEGEGPRAALTGRVEAATVAIAHALPAHQPVRAGCQLQREFVAAWELPLGHRGAGRSL